MTDNVVGITVVASIVFVIVLLGALIWKAAYNQSVVAENKEKCEAAGGVILMNSYRVGKTTKRLRACVKPDIFVEY